MPKLGTTVSKIISFCNKLNFSSFGIFYINILNSLKNIDLMKMLSVFIQESVQEKTKTQNLSTAVDRLK